ncbi:uncharacterized protein LOC119769486 isoform X2 [Culex quinquefasciatus]|uniref:uncharacterized protein LOC119769486 isoform X2 n=1 Tax=Culex quinquefasciatus TaxID=7176 RepID=UPI0018E31966|nr:uncharacterized protein LOC119769486 isoform X2 [Culex quinquefasciatus]
MSSRVMDRLRGVAALKYRQQKWILSLWQVPLVVARRCYICGEGAEAPFRTTMMATTGTAAAVPRIAPTCEDFERDRDEMEQYEHECPPSYTSCLTQVDGDMELRTCGESLSINDCKSANKIDYCYCNDDLCNRLTRTQIRREIEEAQRVGHSLHLKQQQHEPNNSDDEDLSESSGQDPESHEKHQHHARGQIPVGSGHLGGATTQIMVTLKPIPTTERRNDSRAGENETFSSGGRSWWPVESVSLVVLLVGASLRRLQGLVVV